MRTEEDQAEAVDQPCGLYLLPAAADWEAPTNILVYLTDLFLVAMFFCCWNKSKMSVVLRGIIQTKLLDRYCIHNQESAFWSQLNDVGCHILVRDVCRKKHLFFYKAYKQLLTPPYPPRFYKVMLRFFWKKCQGLNYTTLIRLIYGTKTLCNDDIH